MNRLLIVDGSNLLFQMFFGMPSRIINRHGKAIQGTLGFVGALLRIIRMTAPSHIVVLFDGEHENDRTSLDAGYKANRIDYSTVAEDESPFSQLPDIYAALDYMQIRYSETTDCEADDLIAAYVRNCSQTFDIIISSFDSDLFQLINNRVSVLRYRGDRTVICTSKYVQDKFGIVPTQYGDFKALVGDASDNFKGADKIGPKTASELLNTYGNLENILTAAYTIKKPSIRESIIRNAQRLRTNSLLVRLLDNAGLPFAVDQLVWNSDLLSTNQVLTAIGLK